MEYIHYAQVDADGHCFASLSTTTPVDNPGCIQVPSDPDSYIGRTYVDGQWQD